MSVEGDGEEGEMRVKNGREEARGTQSPSPQLSPSAGLSGEPTRGRCLSS
jgi:hypothetical protein